MRIRVQIKNAITHAQFPLMETQFLTPIFDESGKIMHTETEFSSLPSIDEIAWINRFLSMGERLSKGDIQSILCFSLIWNLFESYVCNKRASISSFEKAVFILERCQQFSLLDYDIFLKYFVSRYTANGQINNRFEKLNLHPGDRPELVKAVLVGKETTPEKILFAMLIIIYRYRNNLFHGEKSLKELPDQIENFKYSNQLLMRFLEQWENCGPNKREAKRVYLSEHIKAFE